jgi:peroxiredoxin
MTNIYQPLVFVHVLGALGIFVAFGVESVSLAGRDLLVSPRRLGTISMVGAIAAGVSLMAHGWGRQPWIMSALVGMAGMIAVGGVIWTRSRRTAAALTASLRLRIALAIGIVALMTIKPGAIGAWVILIASALSGLVAADLATSARGRWRVVLSAVALLLLTDVHHVYGARVYQTPWRYHVLLLSVPAMVAILLSRRRLTLVLVTLVVPVLGIGAFEGFYNHLVKDVLYFHGASPALLTRLFPPPTYEMPNDAFFEITGVAQALLGATTAWYLLRFAQGRPRPGRLSPGAWLGQRQLTAISGEVVPVPDADRVVHLQFRRFAGCPVCNLHLQSFVRRHDQITAAGIREVVVFHSPAEELRPHAGHLPFSVIADPDKRLYAAFAVESAARALLDPRAWGAILRGVLRSLGAVMRGREPLPSIRPRGGSLGLPADFLIGRDGRLVASKYGAHADDQWAVDEVLRMAAPARTL